MRKLKNFPITVDGETYWVSRSCCVAGFIYCKDSDGDVCVLANKRGPGAPNCVGLWNVPCGFIDYNEGGSAAVAREVFEETGLQLNEREFYLRAVEFSSNGNQNISIHYTCDMTDAPFSTGIFGLTNEFNEPGETSEIAWIKIGDLNKYEWAFGHKDLIFRYFTECLADRAKKKETKTVGLNDFVNIKLTKAGAETLNRLDEKRRREFEGVVRERVKDPESYLQMHKDVFGSQEKHEDDVLRLTLGELFDRFSGAMFNCGAPVYFTMEV